MSKIDGLLEGKDAQFPRDLGMQRMMSDIVVDLASMYLGGIMDRVHPSLFNLTDLRTGNEWSAAVLFPEINPMLVGSFQDLIILGMTPNLNRPLGFRKIMLDVGEDRKIFSSGNNNYIYTIYRGLRIASGLEAVAHAVLQGWSNQSGLDIELNVEDDCDPAERLKWNSLFINGTQGGYIAGYKIITPNGSDITPYDEIHVQLHPHQQMMNKAVQNYVQGMLVS